MDWTSRFEQLQGTVVVPIPSAALYKEPHVPGLSLDNDRRTMRLEAAEKALEESKKQLYDLQQGYLEAERKLKSSGVISGAALMTEMGHLKNAMGDMAKVIQSREKSIAGLRESTRLKPAVTWTAADGEEKKQVTFFDPRPGLQKLKDREKQCHVCGHWDTHIRNVGGQIQLCNTCYPDWLAKMAWSSPADSNTWAYRALQALNDSCREYQETYHTAGRAKDRGDIPKHVCPDSAIKCINNGDGTYTHVEGFGHSKAAVAERNAAAVAKMVQQIQGIGVHVDDHMRHDLKKIAAKKQRKLVGKTATGDGGWIRVYDDGTTTVVDRYGVMTAHDKDLRSVEWSGSISREELGRRKQAIVESRRLKDKRDSDRKVHKPVFHDFVATEACPWCGYIDAHRFWVEDVWVPWSTSVVVRQCSNCPNFWFAG